MLLHTEDAVVSKAVHRTLVRATRTTTTRDQDVAAELVRDHVEVERVAIGRVVDAVPPVREDGDVLIMPVVEEEIVITKRLILREEVHLRKVRSVIQHVETVVLRDQTVTVTRSEIND